MLKSLFGLFEILAGLLLAASGKLVTDNFIIALAQQEIVDDPNDFIANHIISAANTLQTGANLFAIFYLVFHGVINLALAMALFKNRLWAYPVAIAGFAGFIIYQVYRYLHTHSEMLLALTAFDVLLLIFIALEYRNKIIFMKK